MLLEEGPRVDANLLVVSELAEDLDPQVVALLGVP